MNHERLDKILQSLHATDTSVPVLERICRISCAHSDTDGGGMMRILDGRQAVVAATDGRAERVELLQLDLREGPCIDSFTTMRPLLEPDLGSPRSLSRWPRFAPAAIEHGVAAVFAFPLVTGGSAVGALDLHTTEPRGISGDAMEDVLILADLAALALDRASDGMARVDGVDLRVEAPDPWAHSAIVHNASGMVSAQLGVSVEEALLRLRAAAFATARPLADLARDIVERRIRASLWSSDE